MTPSNLEEFQAVQLPYTTLGLHQLAHKYLLEETTCGELFCVVGCWKAIKALC
jgi:hypothetical protein